LHIFFLHEVSYQKKPIFEMHEFPERLNLLGHRITFLQFDEGFKARRETRSPSSETIDGKVYSNAKINLITPWQFGLPSLDRYLATIVTPIVTLRNLLTDRPDVIVSYSVPTSGWQTLMLAKILRIPFVYRAIDVSHKIRKSRFNWLVRFAERFVLRNADVVSVNNPAMARYAKEVMGSRRPVEFNAPPLDLRFAVSPSGQMRSKVFTKYELEPTDRVLLYLGSFFYFSGLGRFLEQFAPVLKRREDFKFLLVGGGEQEEELKSLARKLGVSEQVIFAGFVPFIDIWPIIGAANAALNPMTPGDVSHFALPNKVIQYLAMGTTVISTRLEGLESVFGGCDELIFENDYTRMAQIAERELLTARPKSIPGAIERFEAEASTKSFETMLSFAAKREDPR
jgi:glycosyltransferase involved in cell wall biosynthesis